MDYLSSANDFHGTNGLCAKINNKHNNIKDIKYKNKSFNFQMNGLNQLSNYTKSP